VLEISARHLLQVDQNRTVALARDFHTWGSVSKSRSLSAAERDRCPSRPSRSASGESLVI
jgi:hypothetical protein